MVFVFELCFIVFVFVVGDIMLGMVCNYVVEEYWVELREGVVEVGDEILGYGELDIGGVVDFVGEVILVVNEDGVGGGFDNFGVVDGLLWNLGEGLMVDNFVGFCGMEMVFLGVVVVLDLVLEEVSSGKGIKSLRVLVVGVRVMVGKVDCVVVVG